MKKVWIVLVAFFVMVQVFPTMAENPEKEFSKIEITQKNCSIPLGLSLTIKIFGTDVNGKSVNLVPDSISIEPSDMGIMLKSNFTPLKTGSITITAKYGSLSDSINVDVYEYKTAQIDLPEIIHTGDTFKPVLTIFDAQGGRHEPFSIDWKTDSSGNCEIDKDNQKITVWAAYGKMKLSCYVNSHWFIEKDIDIKQTQGEHIMLDTSDILFSAWYYGYKPLYIRNIGSVNVQVTCTTNCGWLELRQVPKEIDAGHTAAMFVISSPCLSSSSVLLDGFLEIKVGSHVYKIKVSFINVEGYKECGGCTDQAFDMVLADTKVTLKLPVFGKPGRHFRLESDNPRFSFDSNGYVLPETKDMFTNVTIDTTNPPQEGIIQAKINIIPESGCNSDSFQVTCKLVKSISKIVFEKNSDIAVVDGNEVKLSMKVTTKGSTWYLPLYGMSKILGLKVLKYPTQKSVVIYNDNQILSLFNKDLLEYHYNSEEEQNVFFDYDLPECTIKANSFFGFGVFNSQSDGKKLVIYWVTEPFVPAK